jgi:hypothetical protein
MQDTVMSFRPLMLASLLALAALAPVRADETATSGPVVVELFTSQGCSSCPPADAYLGELAKKPGVIALGFHIDYWNYIGWVDPYSLKLAADRQRDYGHRLGLHYVYTPQMVVDGAAEGVGSEPDKIAPLLRDAAHEARIRPTLALERKPGGGFHIRVGAGKADASATVWLVGFDRAHQTKVLRGENEGATADDFQVVRSFSAVGQWNGGALDLTLPADAATGDSVAVLLQTDGTGPIVTAAKLSGPAS